MLIKKLIFNWAIFVADDKTGENYTCHCAPNYAGTKCEKAYCELEHCVKGVCNHNAVVSHLQTTADNTFITSYIAKYCA